MAASGRAIRVTSEPKIEIVAAPQTRTNAEIRQSRERNGLRTRREHIRGNAMSVGPGDSSAAVLDALR